MKKLIRKDLLEMRRNLTKSEVESKSHKIFTSLCNMDLFKNSKSIMIYMDFRNEVQTNEIINHMLKQDKRPIIPISIPSTKTLILSQLKNPKEDLTEGTYGVLEPREDSIRPFNPNNLDLILVPGVAFDPFGYRVGYGAGYYDRFLSSLKEKVSTIGLSFDLQIIEKVPIDEFDQKLDYILTESKIIHCNK
ncbi:MAG: 5-formyltetrahydrofolate cyclo-ligase [Anaeromicrobium sp.]|uniref:5-formyltetrahydrofolate cyclo-ligase n=1 Tax=Anaeromicrobium sp. TaxID=1929132 RepID=UPI0025E279BC|nr:5-formyltetrahydrofolate cyclo-ligase [Anaeromicrobium sp.]MCT4594552.1 5-formyltetrahydrofolate cyclo-ligase [Anaeromicrobium sp.]